MIVPGMIPMLGITWNRSFRAPGMIPSTFRLYRRTLGMDHPGLGLIPGGPLEGLYPAVTGGFGESGVDRRGIVHGTDVGPGQLPPLPVEDGLEDQLLLGRLEPALLPGDEAVLQPAAAEVEGTFLLLRDGVQVGKGRN